MADLPAPLGESPAFLSHLDHLSQVAPLDRPVLIIGERGTGKELSAARVHYLSRRWSGPMIKLNCAALPEALLEAELFGVEPGAFTGATKRRLGRFELANSGTLFLDEIGNAGLGVQEKILRVVEYGELERLGGSDTITVSVRVVAATNLDLPAEARAGRFREDLLDRLSFDVLTLPPLRARAGDVRRLAEHFGRGMAKDMDAETFPGFSEAAFDSLDQYQWPGNVRELKNVAERATAYWPNPSKPIDKIVFDPFDSPYRLAAKSSPPTSDTRGESGGDLPTPVTLSELPSDFKAAVAIFEKDLLTRALEEARHNQRVAARRLGLGYHQFRNALRKYDLLPSRSSQ